MVLSIAGRSRIDNYCNGTHSFPTNEDLYLRRKAREGTHVAVVVVVVRRADDESDG